MLLNASYHRQLVQARSRRKEGREGSAYPAVDLLIADIPAVDIADIARLAGGAAGTAADAGGDLLVGFHGGGGALGIAVCGEGGEGGEDCEKGGREFHSGCCGGRMDGWMNVGIVGGVVDKN